MSRFFFTSFLSLTLFIGIALPSIALAGDGDIPEGETTYGESYVPCGYEDKLKRTYEIQDGKRVLVGEEEGRDDVVDNPCKFSHIVELAKRLIMGWIIAGVTFAAMGFAYAGFLYITAMGSEEKISHAHSIFLKTTWGFVFMLSAWLIVYTLEKIFLSPAALERSFLYDGDEN